MKIRNPFRDKTREKLLEKQPLPQGMTEFEEWSDRIIAGSLLKADPDSMKFALASMIMHLGPTEAFKDDLYFIHSLRKSAANQIAQARLTQIKLAAQSRLAAEQANEVKSSQEGSSAIKVLPNA